MNGRRYLACFVLAFLVGLGASISVRPELTVRADDQVPISVKIDNFSFEPMMLTVPVGTTVTWVNNDDVPHTIVSEDNTFKSKALDTDDKFSYTFTKPGTYKYFCSVHPKMTAQVVVK